MSMPSSCRLTTKDFSLLELLLGQDASPDEAYLRLLRRKLAAAVVLFREDVPPDLATIDSRVEFTVDGRLTDNRILTHGGECLPGLTLPITTLRGLALLGLTAGEALTVEQPGGRKEQIRLDRVCRQPQADRGQRMREEARAEAASCPDEPGPVIALAARRRRRPLHGSSPPLDPDDDPGPSAA